MKLKLTVVEISNITKKRNRQLEKEDSFISALAGLNRYHGQRQALENRSFLLFGLTRSNLHHISSLMHCSF